MTARALVEDARRDGLVLTVTPSGALRVRGSEAAIAKWMPALRGHKADILAALTDAGLIRGKIGTMTEPTSTEEAAAVAYAEKIQALREQGRVPGSYTATTHCRSCGTVPIFAGAPVRVDSCPWCRNRIEGQPIPRPPVSCADCAHFTADPIGEERHRFVFRWRPAPRADARVPARQAPMCGLPTLADHEARMTTYCRQVIEGGCGGPDRPCVRRGHRKAVCRSSPHPAASP